MAFTAADVKKLREMTNVGMMDCKKALTASDGDMDKAVEWLREKGLAAAAKKSGRIAAEGAVGNCEKNGVGAIVEVNAETDFASKSDKFQDFIKDVADALSRTTRPIWMRCWTASIPALTTIVEILPEKVLVIGENMKIRRFARFDTDTTVPYIHAGGRIGVLVNMAVEGHRRHHGLGKDIVHADRRDESPASGTRASSPRTSRRREEDPRRADGQRPEDGHQAPAGQGKDRCRQAEQVL